MGCNVRTRNHILITYVYFSSNFSISPLLRLQCVETVWSGMSLLKISYINPALNVIQVFFDRKPLTHLTVDTSLYVPYQLLILVRVFADVLEVRNAWIDMSFMPINMCTVLFSLFIVTIFYQKNFRYSFWFYMNLTIFIREISLALGQSSFWFNASKTDMMTSS